MHRTALISRPSSQSQSNISLYLRNATRSYSSDNRKDPAHLLTPPHPPSANPSHPSSTHDSTLRSRMREWSERAGFTVKSHADNFAVTTKTAFSRVGFQLNRVTGYEAIEMLKRQVTEQEARMNAARQAARQAKDAYDQAVSQRSNSQRGVNDLLQRKSNWSDTDVSRFTTLIRQDHLYEQDEVRAKAKVHETEDAVEREFSELMRSILARYHEEQVWSDKIRSASTYGSLVALGLNLFIFVVAIVVVEPWKRRRLAQTFEKKIEQMSIENAAMVDGNMKEISQRLEEQGKLLTQYAFALSVHMADDITDSPSTFERDDKPSQDWVLAIAVGAGAVVSGVISWQACSWFGR